MKNRDEFTFGKEITPAGGKQDEGYEEYLEDKQFGEEMRTKVFLESKEAVFLVEMRCNAGIGISSVPPGWKTGSFCYVGQSA